jgi:acetylornithine deacetylase/succinyl-diaminopimelate desuccinylase-like protein
MDTGVRDYIDAHAGEFFAALKQWLTIPSISADPARSADVRRSGQWLADHLRETGFETAELWETGTPDSPGLPAVFAQWTAADPNAPTVLIYGHHDVQPIEPLDEWESPPFEPAERATARSWPAARPTTRARSCFTLSAPGPGSLPAVRRHRRSRSS